MTREERRQLIAKQTAEFEATKKVEIVPIWMRKDSPLPRLQKESSLKGAKKQKPTKYKSSRWHGQAPKSLSKRWNDGSGGVI